MIPSKNEFPFLILIFLVSLFVRIYKISDYLFFGFEQGRDAQIIQNIYDFKDFVLVGPSTSIGGLFHGPWYYYLMALPYGLSGGNPIAASIFLIILGSTVPVVGFIFASKFFKSRFWAVILTVMLIFSFEYVLYSRWLSNVSPAPLFIILSFFVLWIYIKTLKTKFFFYFVFFASLSSSFQMILFPQYIFLVFILYIFKQLKLPSFKNMALPAFISFCIFAPAVFFDFRNEHITFNSLINFLKEAGQGNSESLFSGVKVYLLQLYQHFIYSLFYVKYFPFQMVLFITIISGIVIGFLMGQKKESIFLLSWWMMSIPLIKISPGNPQYYVAIGLGLIFLFCFSLINLWKVKHLKILTIIFLLLMPVSFFSSVQNVVLNKDIFFRTTQDDLVYLNQRKLLEFINADAKGKPYKFTAFTIPSLHPEGWEYLHKFYYPNSTEVDAKIVYIAIEEKVFPIWENKWIDELGRTNLEYERKFGLIRLQKRVIE